MHQVWRSGFWWLLGFSCQPPGQRGVTAITRGQWLLALTLGLFGRATQAHVKMIVVPPPGPNFLQPGGAREGVAEGLLNQGVHKDPFNRIALCYGL